MAILAAQEVRRPASLQLQSVQGGLKRELAPIDQSKQRAGNYTIPVLFALVQFLAAASTRLGRRALKRSCSEWRSRFSSQPR